MSFLFNLVMLSSLVVPGHLNRASHLVLSHLHASNDQLAAQKAQSLKLSFGIKFLLRFLLAMFLETLFGEGEAHNSIIIVIIFFQLK